MGQRVGGRGKTISDCGLRIADLKAKETGVRRSSKQEHREESWRQSSASSGQLTAPRLRSPRPFDELWASSLGTGRQKLMTTRHFGNSGLGKWREREE